MSKSVASVASYFDSFEKMVQGMILLFISLLLSTPVLAQDCKPDIIVLATQVDIDDFQSNHGPCDTVVEDLVITSSEGVYTTTNLDGLSNLASIGDSLSITNNPLLTSLSGLSALTTVIRIELDANKSLPNLDGLSGITMGIGILRIHNNESLTSLQGLPASLGGIGHLYIGGNDALASLNGIPDMFEVGTLEIEDNLILTSLIGLAGIDAVIQSLVIVNNPMLSELTGIPSATSLERLSISNNNFSASSNLASVGTKEGTLAQIAASNLDAFANLESVSGDLTVSGNSTLADCSGLRKVLDDIDDGEQGPGPGEDGIPDVSGIVRIEGNLPGCNSIEQILGSGNGDEDVFSDGFESEN